MTRCYFRERKHSNAAGIQKGASPHLVRNSVDHGIEPPEVRAQAGKPRSGRLVLRAFHEGAQVNIEIGDDGAGLSAERIRKKAIERGVVTSEQAGRMNEWEIFNLIFLPGFSTAEKVTNVSGRGVGMDVVKTNVEKIGRPVSSTVFEICSNWFRARTNSPTRVISLSRRFTPTRIVSGAASRILASRIC
jgi:hypothetical protein